MSGSSLIPVIVPIMAFVGLAFWIGLVFYADSHPRRARKPSGAGSKPPAAPASAPPPQSVGAAAEERHDQPESEHALAGRRG